MKEGNTRLESISTESFQSEDSCKIMTVDEAGLHFKDFDRHQNYEMSMTTHRNKRKRDNTPIRHGSLPL